MHFLHSRRIIHMDLKSPNILLSSNGTAKIADVGLARVMGSESIANQVVRQHFGRNRFTAKGKTTLEIYCSLCVPTVAAPAWERGGGGVVNPCFMLS